MWWIIFCLSSGKSEKKMPQKEGPGPGPKAAIDLSLFPPETATRIQRGIDGKFLMDLLLVVRWLGWVNYQHPPKSVPRPDPRVPDLAALRKRLTQAQFRGSTPSPPSALLRRGLARGLEPRPTLPRGRSDRGDGGQSGVDAREKSARCQPADSPELSITSPVRPSPHPNSTIPQAPIHPDGSTRSPCLNCLPRTAVRPRAQQITPQLPLLARGHDPVHHEHKKHGKP